MKGYILLIVLQEKLTNLIPRWCYSGVKERSLWSNNKTYCLINKIRTYVKRHPNASAGLTDILMYLKLKQLFWK